MPTNSNDFSIVIAQELYNSQDKFPVDFDIAWKWLDYSTKGNAKRVLLSGVFIEGTDLIINEKRRENIGSSHFGGKQVTTVEVIKLTVDCFKMWAMMSGTEKGKQVRLYFLECEKIAKAKVTNNQALEWIETRAEGKEDRQNLTEAIKRLIEHGLSQGASSGINNYYASITTNCVNINLIDSSQYKDSSIKNKRDRMDVKTLKNVKTFELLLANLIHNSIDDNLNYKDIYKLCKSEMFKLASTYRIKPAKLLNEPIRNQINSGLNKLIA